MKVIKFIIEWLVVFILFNQGGFLTGVAVFYVVVMYGLPLVAKLFLQNDSSASSYTPSPNNPNPPKPSSNDSNDGLNIVYQLRAEFISRDYSGLDMLASILASASIHIAKIDGVISEEEISAIRFTITNEFSNKADQEKIAKVVSMTKTHLLHIGVNGIYDSLLEIIKYHISIIENIEESGRADLAILLFTIMYEVAIADGGIHPSEERLFARLCGYFSLSDESLEIIIRTANYHYQHRKNQATKPDESLRFKDSIVFLGVSVDYTKEDLDKAWRKIAILHHPDKFHNSNPAVYELAKKKFQEAQDAYQYLKEYLDKPRPKIKEDNKPNTQTQETSNSSEIETRLKKLDALRVKGLISEEEYQKKRNEILKDI
ncbi:MAG: TerB family tellurite resistance protein [Leptospiraceae bacterium]|nr:TerB family tellurite resistance protein [Leptospiraceae bacterium]